MQAIIFLVTIFMAHTAGLQAALLNSDTYAQVSSQITQTPSAGTGSLFKAEKVDSLNNLELSPEKDKFIIKQAGTYFMLCVGQAGSTSPDATGYVDCWIVKNGRPLPSSSSRISVDAPLTTGTIVCNFLLELAVGDTLGLMINASGPSLGFVTIKPDLEPIIPSAILSLFKL